MYFYEAAAANLCCVTSGYGGVQTALPAKGVVEDAITPLEAQFNVEMAYAATEAKTEQASALVTRLLEKYEERIGEAPKGKRYQECYDLTTGRPSEEYIRLYDEVKEELASVGISF
jgi:methylamine--corrinoid protein Co-methyltransferase